MLALEVETRSVLPALYLIARAMTLAGTTTDPEAIRARADEAARTLPEEFRVYDMAGVTPVGLITREVFTAHIVDGEFVSIKIPAPGGAP